MPYYPRWASKTRPGELCSGFVRVEARAPFVRGRLVARRRLQNYQRIVQQFLDPFDRLQGLVASLRGDTLWTLLLISNMA
jgi:hypothetical protein